MRYLTCANTYKFKITGMFLGLGLVFAAGMEVENRYHLIEGAMKTWPGVWAYVRQLANKNPLAGGFVPLGALGAIKGYKHGCMPVQVKGRRINKDVRGP